MNPATSEADQATALADLPRTAQYIPKPSGPEAFVSQPVFRQVFRQPEQVADRFGRPRIVDRVMAMVTTIQPGQAFEASDRVYVASPDGSLRRVGKVSGGKKARRAARAAVKAGV